MSLYIDLANQIALGIDQGAYQDGDNLPGVRRTSTAEGVSPTTVCCGVSTA